MFSNHQLANDSEQNFLVISKTLVNETYVDDILSGGYDLAKTSITQIIEVLETAGLPLRKITANNRSLLNDVNQSDLLEP